MESQARKSFDENLGDIDRLLALHEDKGGTEKGRRYGLEVLNKSAVVLICSYWEAYCEDIASEALAHLIKHAKSPDQLPKILRQVLATELKNDSNQLAVWRLAGSNWRKEIESRFETIKRQRNRKLNTPKSAEIDKLFSEAIGLENVSSSWRWSKKLTIDGARKKLDGFIELRGAIAHRGKASKSVTKAQATDFLSFAKNLAARTGGKVNTFVTQAVGSALW